MASLNKCSNYRREANKSFSSYHPYILTYSDSEIIFCNKFCNKFSYNEISLDFSMELFK